MKSNHHPPPKLFYLVGPSGSGKDSLITYVRERLNDSSVRVARRHITRAQDAGGEDHIAVSTDEFERLRQANAFALHWRGNGLQYGIGSEIDAWLAAGQSVLVNGSRAHLPKALERYPSLCPILIDVADEVLIDRLLARGRESLAEIHARIERNKSISPLTHNALVVISNNHDLAVAGDQLLSVLTQGQSFISNHSIT
ncbi:MAG: phosphonate metabolism protein/1,5-bisphosphokinase (PRPP-forming) PhnN [Orrella sp.]